MQAFFRLEKSLIFFSVLLGVKARRLKDERILIHGDPAKDPVSTDKINKGEATLEINRGAEWKIIHAGTRAGLLRH